MKKKSLLVGASSPYVGPWVPYEGEWMLEEIPEGVNVNFQGYIDGEVTKIGDNLRVTGRGKVRLELVEGTNVCLSLIQVANA